MANKLRLLRLSYEEQRLILEHGLTERHARASLRLNDPQSRLDTIRHMGEQRLNVQESERYIEELLEKEEEQKRSSLPCVTTKNGEMISSDVFHEERDMMDMVQILRRRVDGWRKNGKNATISVTNGLRSVEVTIRLAK